VDSIRITHNDIPQVRLLLQEFARVNAPRIAARVLRKRTIERTKSGMSVEGSAFGPYTRTYMNDFRKKHGLPTSPVDLYGLGEDGHMLESLDYYDRLTTSAGTGHALAVSAEANPRAVGNQNHRHWLGVATGDDLAVEDALVHGFNKLRVGEAIPHEPIL
jgi:hypothetical protein